MLMLRQWAALVAGMAVAVMMGGGAGGPSSARLILPPDTNLVAETQGGMRPGQPQADGEELVCLDRPGSVHVEAVRPVKPTGGLHVQEFVLQKSPWMAGPDRNSIGGGYDTLKQAGVLKDNVKTLTMVCNAKTGAGYIVDIQMAYTHGRFGHTDGFEVDYVPWRDPHVACPARLTGMRHAPRADPLAVCRHRRGRPVLNTSAQRRSACSMIGPFRSEIASSVAGDRSSYGTPARGWVVPWPVPRRTVLTR